MMKFVQWSLATLGGLVLLLLVVGLFLPSAFSVQRSAVINATPNKVYNLVVEPKQWTKWSVWTQRDPDMKITYSGPPFGMGARWSWVLELPMAGEQPQMRFGDGRVEGFGGCNRFAARYVQDVVGARSIAIGRIEVVRRLCDPGPQAAEARVLEVLQSVSSYSITGDNMTMNRSGRTPCLIAVSQ